MAPTKQSAPTIYVADDDGYANIDGIPYYFHRGVSTVEDGHPLLKSTPASWRPFTPTWTKAQHAEWKRQAERKTEPEPDPEPEPTAA